LFPYVEELSQGEHLGLGRLYVYYTVCTVGVEPIKARRRREDANAGRNFLLLAIDEYVKV
jgi:hypothetical protein